jgi:hypothetical protein
LDDQEYEVDENIVANLASTSVVPKKKLQQLLELEEVLYKEKFLGKLLMIIANKGKASNKIVNKEKHQDVWKKALKDENVNMQIWLSKNVLNMRDKIETQNIVEPLPLIIEADVKDG